MSHGLLPADVRKTAHTVSGLDKTLSSEGGTTCPALPAHAPLVCRSKNHGNQLMQSFLSSPNEGNRYRLAILRIKFNWRNLLVKKHNWDWKAWLSSHAFWKSHYFTGSYSWEYCVFSSYFSPAITQTCTSLTILSNFTTLPERRPISRNSFFDVKALSIDKIGIGEQD